MAGPISQAESDVIYRRLQNAAKAALDIWEEVQRLRSLGASLNLGANLDNHSRGAVTKADAIALFDWLQDYESFFGNLDTAADGVAGSNDRRAKLDVFLLPENI